MNKKVVIVGSGIAGLSLAYWLKDGCHNLEVELIDENLNRSASDKSAGFLTSGSLLFYNDLIQKHGFLKAEEIWQFAKKNINEIRFFIEQNKLDVSLNWNGSYTLLSEDKIKLPFNTGRVKHIDKFKNYVCYFDPEEGSFEPRLFVDNLKSIVKNMGVIFKSLQIKDLESLKQNHKSDHCFITTNSSKLFGKEITRHRAQAAEFKINSNLSKANYYIPEQKIYFRVDDTRLIIGGLRILDLQNEETDELGINRKIQNALEKFVLEFIDNEALKVKEWSGLMGFTQDGLPLIKLLDTDTTFLGGFSGHGNGLAFLASKLLANEYLSNKIETDLEIFR